uniref:Uncharacterized protein n=1 Tax=Leptocylindrus danicus TaxID=163516 RepID=A0A7S2KZD6_9STRA|mmetsp:Transcript_29250/g.42945  ORF Transcript_29250/g.42945 Transcript_29250/m.42945 type:complete len:570 (+) Transcript_29250:62-1771(+)
MNDNTPAPAMKYRDAAYAKNQQESDYYPADPYYDEHEEINDLQALSELVPNILDENKVGWRMTSSNDEIWKSDQHLLESKFSNECPARKHILSRQKQNKGDDIHGRLASKVAEFDEQEMGAEAGLEIVADEDLLSSLNPSKHNTPVPKLNEVEDVHVEGTTTANGEFPIDEKQTTSNSKGRSEKMMHNSLRFASVMHMNMDADVDNADDDGGSGSEIDLKNEVAAEEKLAKDGGEKCSENSSAVDTKLALCLSQDLDDLGTVRTLGSCTVKTLGTVKTVEKEKKQENKHDESSTSKIVVAKLAVDDNDGVSKKEREDGNDDDDEKQQNTIVKTMHKVTLQETSDKRMDGSMSKAKSSSKLKGNYESAAPPTITARMPLSLPTFKPATGCTNASDFIVRCFVARLRSGITVVKHGRSRWCKSRLRILHVHPDGRSLSWKPAVGEPTSSKRPPKLDLSTCQEVRHAWSGDPLHPNYTGTTILRSKCEPVNAHKSFSLVFPKRTVDITAITADQCKVLMEGLSALCFRLQVANIAGRNKKGEDEDRNSRNSNPTSTTSATTTRNINVMNVES